MPRPGLALWRGPELLRHYDPPRLGVNLDPSHGMLVGNDIPWAVRRWGPLIRHFHLKGCGGPARHVRRGLRLPVVGEGAVPRPDFFSAVDDIGYEGYLSVEFESWDYYGQVLPGDPVEAAPPDGAPGTPGPPEGCR